MIRISKVYILFAAILYLLLPNVLFLLGWVKPCYAIPLSIILLLSVGAIFYTISKQMVKCKIDVCICSKYDILALFISLLFLLVITDFIGYHGHIQQAHDLFVRNPLYDLLIKRDWPIYNSDGEYLAYYHAFWLVPALVSKVFGTILSPATCVFIWSYLGLSLGVLTLFLRLRARVLSFILILFFLGNWIELATGLYRYFDHINHYGVPAQLLRYMGYGAMFRYLHFEAALYYCFNQTIPAFLSICLLMTREIFMPYKWVVIALSVVCSPIVCIVEIIYLIIPYIASRCYVNHLGRHFFPVLCALCLLPVPLYFLCNSHSSSLNFVWQNAQGMEFKTDEIAIPYVRFARIILISVALMGPLFYLMRKHICKGYLFRFTLFISIFLPIVYMGGRVNEFFWKGSLFLFASASYLMAINWRYIMFKKRVIACIFIVASSFHVPNDLFFVRSITDYTWDTEKAKSHIINEIHDIEHPLPYLHQYFWAENKYPHLLINHAGEAMHFGPLSLIRTITTTKDSNKPHSRPPEQN